MKVMITELKYRAPTNDDSKSIAQDMKDMFLVSSHVNIREDLADIHQVMTNNQDIWSLNSHMGLDLQAHDEMFMSKDGKQNISFMLIKIIVMYE